MNENKYFPIDCTKVVLALMIVAMHTGLPGEMPHTVQRIIEPLLEIAVPLFFVFSGFFFARKMNWRQTSSRILRLYAFWLLLSWPLCFNNYEGLTVIECIQKTIFSGAFNVAWFLVTLLWCTVITGMTLRSKKHWTLRFVALSIVATVLYIMCISSFCYPQMAEFEPLGFLMRGYRTLFFTINWSVPHGLLFFLIGVGIYHYRIRMKTGWAWSLLILSLIFFAFECYYLSVYGLKHRNPSAAFSVPPLAIAILMTMLCYCRPTPTAARGKLMREYSTMLYLAHPMIMFLLFWFFGFKSGIAGFSATLAIFTFAFMLYQRLRPKFPILKYAC